MKRVIITTLLLMVCGIGHAQWTCPSRLSGALKPIGKTNLSWAAEIEASGGWVKDSYASNAMGFLGLNHTKGNSTLYVEGGVKGWLRGRNHEWEVLDNAGTTTYNGDQTNKVIAGLREAFYKFDNQKNTVCVGLQSARGDEDYLLNERMVGLNYTLRTNAIKVNVMGGSVMQAFARNGRFCSMGYIYNDIVVGRPRTFLGTNFTDADFAMASLSFTPQKEDDEFGGSELSIFTVNKLGIVGYSEFGTLVPDLLLTGGVYGDFSIADISIRPEVLMQSSENNNAIIYNVTFDKKVLWDNTQSTRFYARYVGYYALTEGARPANSDSNLFMGEVLRQDVLEAPLAQLAFKHSFPEAKCSVKVQGTIQVKPSKIGNNENDFVMDEYTSPTLPRMKELDVSLSKNFGEHVWIDATVGGLVFPNFTVTDIKLHYNSVKTLFGQLQCRITF